MAYNVNEDDERMREPGEGILPETSGGPGAAPPAAPPGGTGVERVGEPAPDPELSVENRRMLDELARWRRRFHDVPDDRFDQIVQTLRNRESIHSIARGIIEQGYCAHLHPTTVRMNLTKFRDAMGFPKHETHELGPEPPARIAKEDELEELIEGSPVMKRLGWLIRIQQSRVRKALRFEGRMADMILPMASSEIKLLADLLDKELEVALKTGEMKTVPQAVTWRGPISR